MLQLDNKTPFDSQIMLTTNPKGADVVVLAVKGTFTLLPNVAMAAEQIPLKMEDEHLDDPALSSLRYASEMLLPKPGSDVILNGHAYVPEGQKASVIDTRLSIGDVSKTVRVFGDRLWLHGGQSAPALFDEMPLIYENAFGGLHHYQADKPVGPDSAIAFFTNPLGKGFIGKRKNKEMIGEKLPNLEDPRFLIRTPQDQPTPMNYGYIPAAWSPRKDYAGTYDEHWTKTRAPFLPLDFDERFFLGGSTGLSFERRTFMGGEPVRLINLMKEEEDIQFNLPDCPLDTQFKFNGQWNESPAAIETIIIEPDENRFCIIWKTAFNCNKKPLNVSDVRVSFKHTEDQGGVV
ncbi:MAG: hypothetical protein ACI9T7_001346 [Oleiphilaceae bacterium]|jgi:hypothetical protein